MKRFVGLTFVMFLAVAFGSSVVEAGCKHRRHFGHGCHAGSCATAECESAPVVHECAVTVEECVVEESAASHCEPAASHCGHRRHRCGLFGHKRRGHHRHHAHSSCEPVAQSCGSCGGETVVTSSSACASGDCNGGEVVTSGGVVTHDAAPASTEVIKEGRPTPAAPAAPAAPAVPAAPKAPAASGT